MQVDEGATSPCVAARTQTVPIVLGSESLHCVLQIGRATKPGVRTVQSIVDGGVVMHKVVKSVSGALVGLLYGCSTVFAATVSGPSGSVHINQGNGFVPITNDAQLAPGGQVMVKPGAVAVISYGNNCSVKVDSGRVWTIQEAAPCAKGEAEIDLTTRMSQAGMGGGPDPLVVVAIAGGVVLVTCLVWWCRSDGSKGASK